MSDIISNLGQGFTDTISEFKDYFSDGMLFQWLPQDIQIVLAAVLVVLVIIAIKRAVFV